LTGREAPYTVGTASLPPPECRVNAQSLPFRCHGRAGHTLKAERMEANVSEKCELLEKCGFFLNCAGNSEVIKAGWVRLYCESQEKSESCERKRIRRQTGRPPQDNMCPTGEILTI
jgi:hypothetical protein